MRQMSETQWKKQEIRNEVNALLTIERYEMMDEFTPTVVLEYVQKTLPMTSDTVVRRIGGKSQYWARIRAKYGALSVTVGDDKGSEGGAGVLYPLFYNYDRRELRIFLKQLNVAWYLCKKEIKERSKITKTN